MSLSSFLKKTLSDFRGAWLLTDQAQQNASRASLCQNMRIQPGKAFTRSGLALLATIGASAIRTFYNQFTMYLNVEYNRILYLEGANLVKLYYLDGSVLTNPTSLYTQACAGLSVAEAETRLYIAHFLANTTAAGPLKILNALISGQPCDNAFPDPPAGCTITVRDTGAGAVGAGQHKFCLRVISRTGFPGKPTCITAATVAPGGRALAIDITTPAMVDSSALQIGMTTVDNEVQFWDVPGASIGYLPGMTSFFGIPINISDDELVALPATSDLTASFDYLTGSGAPTPSKVATFGNRNVYIAGARAYISDPYNLQVLLEPDNAVQVDGQRTIVTCSPLGASLAFFGPNYTFLIGGDNSRKPNQWTPPARVSDTIGTQCVNGAIVAAGSAFLWVASDLGLYTLAGSKYGDIPVSYMFARDWARINWAAARAYLQMVDNAAEHCLYINVPLDGSAECNYRMVIDYSRAKSTYGVTVDPYSVDYSLDVYHGGEATPSIGQIRNPTTKEQEVCLGLSDGTIFRHDPALRHDRTHAINSVYETGLNMAASELRTLLTKFAGMHVQLKGDGEMAVTPWGLGRQVTSDDAVDPIELEESPDGMVESRWHMASENQSIRMETGQDDLKIDSWFEISGLKVYYRPSGTTKAS